jgi:hypothetical protein
MIDTYIKEIASITKRGDAREESYYPALAVLLEEFSETERKKKVHVTVLPKKTEAGNPDFRVWDGKHSQVGYIEAKAPKANLDEIETSDQLKRYISTFPNLILTNFYEFRLYRNGQRVDNVLLARPYIPEKLKTIPPAEHTAEFLALLEKFFQFSLPTKFTAESLAKELATRTRFLRDQVIKEELREASDAGAKKILGFYEAFQKHLIFNLKPDEFADLYAQTITYGLFAARTRANGAFNRILAYDLIPKTIGILREIFHFVSFDPAEQLQATVDDIAEVLAVADVRNILRQYFKEGKGSDPIFHFYETFLAEYNPQERERRGVYYTPEPVVSYIVRSLNIILKETFGRQDGFATQSVTVLDPAGGTLTFLAIFILLTTRLSNVSAQNSFDSNLTEEKQISIQQELENPHLQEKSVSSIEKSSSSTHPDGEEPFVKVLEAPIPEESNGDFNLEIHPGNLGKKEPSFDIPIVINDKVEQFIQYFQKTIRHKFVTWLARSEKYVPFMKNLLKEHGLPEDLVYMALIESGFDPYAYSRSKASGLWQFIYLTGKRYGLKVNWWVDERRDPEKATIAAAKYLKDLYEMFKCWYLAAAGYNAGEYKIIRAMKRYRTEDFWKLTKHRYLKRETKDYVPQMIAAALISKDPRKYGFTDFEYQEPLRYEKVKVPELTDLSRIARACETTVDEIKEFNPELRRRVTPPTETEYEIKIPSGKKDVFLKNFEALQPFEKFQFKTHLVKKGETLREIARLYRVDLEPLLEINHLNNKSRVSKGMTLFIPIQKYEEIDPLTPAEKKNGKLRNSRPDK